MKASGIIIAALDCAPDAIESGNSWYDHDHLPPNVGLPGIMSGRRYVASLELNALRTGVDGSWWADRNEAIKPHVYDWADDLRAAGLPRM